MPAVLTLGKHDRFPSWWKHSVCTVSLYSVRQQRYYSRSRSISGAKTPECPPGVSLSSDIRNHCPPSLSPPSLPHPPLLPLWPPACGAAFSLDDLHGTSHRSSGRRFSEHLLVESSSRVRITKPQRATSQSESPAGFRPTPEQLSRETKIRHVPGLFFFYLSPNTGCVRRSAQRTRSCRVDSKCFYLIINKNRVFFFLKT